MGSNMAEQHPVGFQWVVEAKERGAKVIHVDPRFTRTSAMADLHVPIRPGTDIAFLGGIVNYIFEHEAWFTEYVRHYTNGPVIIKPEFRDTDDASGFFSGWNAEHSAYGIATWGYKKTSGETTAGKMEQQADVSGEQAHGAHGMKLEGGNPPDIDHTVQDEHCVLQLVRRHFARYTPELVSEVCGCSAGDFVAVAEALCRNSGRERTSAIAYAVGWTQHTVGVQNVRAASLAGGLIQVNPIWQWGPFHTYLSENGAQPDWYRLADRSATADAELRARGRQPHGHPGPVLGRRPIPAGRVRCSLHVACARAEDHPGPTPPRPARSPARSADPDRDRSRIPQLGGDRVRRGLDGPAVLPASRLLHGDTSTSGASACGCCRS